MKNLLLKLTFLACVLFMSNKTYASDFQSGGIYYTVISEKDFQVGVDGNPSLMQNTTYKGDITIPSTVNYNNRTYTVTAILPSAFGGMQKGCEITSVSIPSTVTLIDENAFGNCWYLTTVTGGENVELIRKKAFYSCYVLKGFNFGKNLTNIGEDAFTLCKAITTVVLNDNVEIIDTSAFSYCTSLQNVVLGANTDRLGSFVFSECSSLSAVYFRSLTKPEINTSTFYHTPSDVTMYVPSKEIYGMGTSYLVIYDDVFMYSGLANKIDWASNLTFLNCNVLNEYTEVNAGDYNQNLNVEFTGEFNFNVTIPYSYTILQEPLTVTVNDTERYYGDPNPAFTCDVNGFVNGETFESIGASPRYSCGASVSSDVGTYPVTVEVNLRNYDVTYKYGELTVVPAPLTVTIENCSKTYGDPNPEFVMTYTGLKNNATTPPWETRPTITCEATQQSDAGTYPITVSGAVLKNYIVKEYKNGTLTINKKNLTVSADNVTRYYHEENPELNISYNGFVLNQTEKDLTKEPVATCTATYESNAGDYPIVVAGGESKNYEFNYVDGILTVLPIEIGFIDEYNTVVYNDMEVSTTSSLFNYIPAMLSKYDEDEFKIEVWALDLDDNFTEHVFTQPTGEYAGNYVIADLYAETIAGKYIFNIQSDEDNINYVTKQSRCYLTVESAPTNLEWTLESPIVIDLGQVRDLQISYNASDELQFVTDYDSEIINVTSSGETTDSPQWFVTGLALGETDLSFSIECEKNMYGFYNYENSKVLTRRVRVVPEGEGSVYGLTSDSMTISVLGNDIIIVNKPEQSECSLYDFNGKLIRNTRESELRHLEKGIYILKVGSQTYKIVI